MIKAYSTNGVDYVDEVRCTWRVVVLSVDPVPGVQVLFSGYDIGDAGTRQCGGTGWSLTPVNEWTPTLRIDTDNRDGGCSLQLGLVKASTWLNGAISTDWQAHPGANDSQCLDRGRQDWPTLGLNRIVIDTDDRRGWCDLTFDVTDPAVAVDVSFYPDGNGQCVNSTGDSGFHTAYRGHPVTIGIDTDSRNGGCQFAVRVRTNFTPPPPPEPRLILDCAPTRQRYYCDARIANDNQSDYSITWTGPAITPTSGAWSVSGDCAAGQNVTVAAAASRSTPPRTLDAMTSFTCLGPRDSIP
ncbi:MAG: hypothetical protein ACRCY8_01095 [Dermatophilaceae bacterium]